AAFALAMTFRMPSAGVRAETLIMFAALVPLIKPAAGVRRAGYAAATLLLLALLTSSGGGHDDPSGWWLACLAVVLYFAATRFVTTRAGWIGVAALAVWWVPMLLSSGMRAHPGYALATVVAAVLAGAVFGRTAALGAGAATCLLIFLAAVGTYAVAPQLAPDVAPTREANWIEATDPYVAELLLGGLLGATLVPARPGGPGRQGRPYAA